MYFFTLRGLFQNLTSGQGQVITQVEQYAYLPKRLDELSHSAPFAHIYEMSTQHPHLTANEKNRERAYYAWKWRIHVRLQCPSGVCDRCSQEDVEWSRKGTNCQRALTGRDTQQPRRASSDQEGAKQSWGQWQRPRERWLASSVPGKLTSVSCLIFII